MNSNKDTIWAGDHHLGVEIYYSLWMVMNDFSGCPMLCIGHLLEVKYLCLMLGLVIIGPVNHGTFHIDGDGAVWPSCLPCSVSVWTVV
jgi:hypothetical protein